VAADVLDIREPICESIGRLFDADQSVDHSMLDTGVCGVVSDLDDSRQCECFSLRGAPFDETLRSYTEGFAPSLTPSVTASVFVELKHVSSDRLTLPDLVLDQNLRVAASVAHGLAGCEDSDLSGVLFEVNIRGKVVLPDEPALVCLP
jgi:hypothetical protein